MKATIIKLLLLLSLSFNITHAAFIAMEDDHTACHHAIAMEDDHTACHHATATQFVSEQSGGDDCGDLCKMHHFFHFMAILDTTLPTLEVPAIQDTPQTKVTAYTPPFETTEHKPPIYT